MNVGSVFSGIGLLDFGLTLAGLDHRWFCEVDPFRREVLARRWPGVRIFDDVRAVGSTAERVDVIAGGFPCKGASTAGKRNGFEHPETRLWREMARAVGELRPRYVVVENVANILGLHDGAVWGEVLGDLAALGYDVEWDCIPAAAFGAPHLRDRIVAVATDADRPQEQRLAGVEGEQAGWPHLGRGHLRAVADASGDGLRVEPEPERRGGCQAVTAVACEVAPDTCGGGQPEHAKRDGEQRQRVHGAPRANAQRRGVAVEWGKYEPAIRRWETVHGPAPEPLIRTGAESKVCGVDDGSARKLERSRMRVNRQRLSGLGDGVQVQLGFMVGRFLMRQHP